MRVSNITILGDSVYELKKGFRDRELGNGDVAKPQLDGVVIGSISRTL